MTTSLTTRGCFLQLEKNAKDDNEPFDLLLSSTTKEKTIKDDDKSGSRLIVIVWN
jgi:hypothetical protein